MNEVWEDITLDSWPDRAEKFAKLLNEKVAKIPEEYRSNAQIRFIADDDCMYQIQLSWLRPETQADIDKRNNKEKALLEYQKQRELETLEKLKAKYEKE